MKNICAPRFLQNAKKFLHGEYLQSFTFSTTLLVFTRTEKISLQTVEFFGGLYT